MDGMWGIVLAGGRGRRVEEFIRERSGRSCPKQFFAFTGRRTMLEHTLDRMERMIRADRIFVVVGAEHAPYVASLSKARPATRFLFQPRNRETLPGVLLPLVHVLNRNPEGKVVIFPSDHFVWEETRFIDPIRWNVRLLDSFPESLTLLGIRPDLPEPEYGWIEPRRVVCESDGYSALSVGSFHEKPAKRKARALMKLGGLWNTLIFAARAATLYRLARSAAPEMVGCFDRLINDIGGAGEGATLQRIYTEMAPANISKDLFEKIPGHLLVTPVEEVGWSDWGSPERIVRTLRRYGKALRLKGAADSRGEGSEKDNWEKIQQSGASV
ncbi:sugar phosphate nucleotidyltransferase [Candidatus Manganitrophus noduliformans]|uniref:NTP transferase domain-containing protein n=1 Tax=Candidatus Manganitrophus noduliformans TaxID=2606439 RepID=A0A7X6IAC6_9BACT|nr:sugar phosphate nucleotidyltransferase [Candidatus Manganitrophus noduliformans]NKE70254.1 NTP transferase domain-containing protein [Candidatus Manganitrophus noduliformans]